MQIVRKYQHDICCGLFLLALVLIFFSKVLVFSEPGVLSNPGSADLVSQFFPWRYFGFQSVKNGEFPLWNPYLFCGSPFLGEIQTSLFYPLNAIFLILPTHAGLTASVVLHVYMAGLFTFLFLRHAKLERPPALLGAVTFMLSTPVIYHIYPGHISNICTVAWIPLIFLLLDAWCSRQRWIFALLLGFAFACQILAGHIQYVFYAGVGMVIFLGLQLIFDVECREKWRLLISGFVMAMALSVLLTAVQLLPTWEAVGLSVRKELTFDFIGTFSFPPENFLTILLPGFFGDGINTRYWGRCYLWEMSLYIGLMPLLLAVTALVTRRTKETVVFGLLALVTMILALGKYTPLLKLLYHSVPGFDLFRGSSKFISLTVFALAVLSAHGAQYLLEALQRNQRKPFDIQVFACGGLVLLLLGFLGVVSADDGAVWGGILRKSAGLTRLFNPLGEVNDPHIIQYTLSWTRKEILTAVSFLVVGGVIFFLAASRKIKGSLVLGLIIALTVLDLGLLGVKCVVQVPLDMCFWDEETVAFLQEDPEIYRVGLVNDMVPGLNQGMNNGIASMGGYGSNNLERFGKFFNLSQGQPLESPTLVMTLGRLSPLINLLNVKYLLVPAGNNIEHPHLKPVFQNKEVRIYLNIKYLPRAFLVHRSRLFMDEKGMLAALVEPDFDPAKEVLLEEEYQGKLPENQREMGEDSAEILHYGLNRVVIETKSPASAFLVLSDVFYPGWKVYLDGEEANIFSAYYTLRAVYIPEGKHRVTFVYAPWMFKVGAGISLASLLVGVAVLVLGANVKQKKEVFDA